MPEISTKPTTILNLLHSILTQSSHQTQTTLVICSNKATFVEHLQHELETWQAPRDEIPASQEDEGEDLSARSPVVRPLSTDDGNENPTAPHQEHPFLTPTLHLLASSRNVKLVFIPSVTALRAYLATWPPTSSTASDPTTSPSTRVLRQNLTIVDILALHHDTSEFTFQGLSRTFSVVASAAHREGCVLNMVECCGRERDVGLEEGKSLWDAEVPLLSGSIGVRTGGVGGWAGRKIGVKKVVERWFGFVDA